MPRETILSAVRTALAGDRVPPLAPIAVGAADARDGAALAARFTHEARAVGTIVHEVGSRAAAVDTLVAILGAAAPAPRVVAWPTALARELAAAAVARIVGADLLLVERTTPADAIAAADLGITEADVLVAASGTLVLRARGRARTVSLLPPTHVAVVGRERLVADLGAALARVRTTAERDSCLTLITGPSRTADIEKKLVVGVHGPCTLHVVLLERTEA